jgi:hypothetical protein
MTNTPSVKGAPSGPEDERKSDEKASCSKDLAMTPPPAREDDLVAEQRPSFKSSAVDSRMDPPKVIEVEALISDEAALACPATVEVSPWCSKMRTTLYQRSQEEAVRRIG